MDNHKQDNQDDDSNSNKKETPGEEETSSSSTSPQPKDVLHPDACSICLKNESILDGPPFILCTGCEKCMHKSCKEEQCASEMILETEYNCPMCRTKDLPTGSEEEITRLREWTKKKMPWAQA